MQYFDALPMMLILVPSGIPYTRPDCIVLMPDNVDLTFFLSNP